MREKLWKGILIVAIVGEVILILMVARLKIPPPPVGTVEITKEVPVEVTRIVEKKVVVTATPTPTRVLATATPVPLTPVPAQPCFFDLRLPIRGMPGVEIENDRPGWDGKANGLVSYIKSSGGGRFFCQLWGPEGVWDKELDKKLVEMVCCEKAYNLQEIWFDNVDRQLNDTVQWIELDPSESAIVYEHDPANPEFPGITIHLACPTDPS